jgi:hypothetical protein
MCHCLQKVLHYKLQTAFPQHPYVTQTPSSWFWCFQHLQVVSARCTVGAHAEQLHMGGCPLGSSANVSSYACFSASFRMCPRVGGGWCGVRLDACCTASFRMCTRVGGCWCGARLHACMKLTCAAHLHACSHCSSAVLCPTRAQPRGFTKSMIMGLQQAGPQAAQLRLTCFHCTPPREAGRSCPWLGGHWLLIVVASLARLIVPVEVPHVDGLHTSVALQFRAAAAGLCRPKEPLN